MKLNLDGFQKHLNGSLASVYLIEGNESLLIEEALEGLHNALKAQGFLERLTLNLDGSFNLSELDSLTQNFSLFAEKKRIVVNCGEKMPAELAAWIVNFCAQNQSAEDLCLIFKIAKLSSNEKKAKWVTAIEAAGVLLTIYEVEIAEFPRWLDTRLFKEQIKLTPEARGALIEQTEGNLLAASQIIKKLSLLRRDKPLTFTELEPLLAEDARYDLFDLSRHVLLGDIKRSLKILEHLTHESEPVLVLWVLSKEIKTLLTLHVKKGRVPLPELYRSLQIWDKRKAEVEAGLRRLSAAKLADALAFSAKIDFAIKGLDAGDPWAMLKQLLVSLK